MSRSVSVGRIRRAFGSHAKLAVTAAAAVVPLSLIVVGSAQPAWAHTNSALCGTDVSSNLTLTGNVDCSTFTSGTALTITENGVILNLSGFTITGPGGSSSTSGIYSEDNNNVTIENGTIRNFENDIYVYGGSSLTVSSVNLLLNGSQSYTGFRGDYLAGATINNLLSSNAYRGSDVAFSASVTIKNSRVQNTDDAGFHEFSSTGDTYMSDIATNSGDDGFSAYHSSNETYINDRVSGIFGDGFEVKNYGNGSAVIENNFANNTGSDGIYLYEVYSSVPGGQGATVTGNQANGNFYDGIDAYEPYGALFSHNTTNNSFDGDGMYLDYPAGATVTHNTANNNEYNGISVDDNGGSNDLVAGSFNNAQGNEDWDLLGDFPVPGSGNHATYCDNWVCVP